MVRDPIQPGEYTVRAVAQRLGLPVATLRSWNRRYDIGPQLHRPGSHRHYTQTDIAVAARMLTLIQGGASPASAARAAATLRDSVPALGDRRTLLAHVFALDTAEVSRIVAAHLTHHGVVATWDLLCRPAFADVFAAQAGGDRCIDVEHGLSWAVQASFHLAIPPLRTGATTSVVLACTSGEAHVLPLEALRAALAEQGVAARMLGAAVPVAALEEMLTRIPRPVVVVLWSQRTSTAQSAAVRAIAALQARVLVAGPGWAGAALPPGTERIDSLADAVARISAHSLVRDR